MHGRLWVSGTVTFLLVVGVVVERSARAYRAPAGRLAMPIGLVRHICLYALGLQKMRCGQREMWDVKGGKKQTCKTAGNRQIGEMEMERDGGEAHSH